MSKSMYCPKCGAYVGDCGHVSGGTSSPSTINGTCSCGNYFSVTCYGGCLRAEDNNKEDKTSADESN